MSTNTPARPEQAHEQARERAERLNGVLRAIRNVNQLITREDDRQRLIDGACANLTETLSYHNAWIALVEESGEVSATAQSGLDGGFEPLHERLHRGGFSDCMRRALADDRVVMVIDPVIECRACPLAGAYHGRAGLARRLTFGGKTYGVLAASVPVTYANDKGEELLFDEVAGDLAFALYKIDMTARKREVEQKFKQIYDHMATGVAQVSLDFRIEHANPAYCGMLGMSEEELIGKTLADITMPEVLDENLRKQRSLANGEIDSYRMEKVFRHRDGHAVYGILDANAIRDAKGNSLYFLGTVIDITERKRAEEALRESEERYRGLLTNLEAGVVVHAPDTSVIMNNPKAAELLGLSDEQMRGKLANDPGWKFIRNNGMPCLVEEYPVNQIARERQPIRDLVFGIERPATSDVAWVSVNGFPVLDRNGEMAEIVTSFIDITERKRAEEMIADSEQKYRLAFMTSPDSININRMSDGLYIEINEGFQNIMGYTREDVIGRTSTELNIWKDLEDRKRLLDGLRRDGYVENLSASFCRADGTIREGLMSACVIELDGEPCILSITRDITERKQLEAQLRQAQKMESVGRLAGGVAHDFNNLLMGIMGYADLCREDLPANHPVREWVDEITREAQRSANLTRQLLAFARRQTVAPQVIDLNDVVGNMLKMLRRLIGEDIDLAWQPGAEPWSVKIDPVQVDQILANLCVNARDAIGGAGKITIETDNASIDADYCARHAEAVPGSYVTLAVSDDGCGMDHETLGKLFEPFFTTKPTGEGTGLGLATVYGIVKQNNGFINVYSEPGKGTTFRIYLPRETSVDKVVTDAATKTGVQGGTETILLVEDEKAIRLTIRLFLERFGYTVIAAESPAEALRLASGRRDGIDLLITDVVMPGMSGRELAGKLAVDYPSMKILYMSGYTANVIAHRGILEDGVQFIGKPVGRDALAQKVREVLG